MKMIKISKLSENVQGFWAVPLSGFGHTADEQPMPYLECNGVALTPRFGGEEDSTESNNESLPLPKGILKTQWPLSQRIFNFFRRRVNIYWRNIFKTHTRKDKKFLFIEQMNYKETESGFKGNCPLICFIRNFLIRGDQLFVEDRILFKKRVEFVEFEYAMTPTLRCDSNPKKILLEVNVKQNHHYPIQSSTGCSQIKSRKVENVIYEKNQELEVHYCYKVVQ